MAVASTTTSAAPFAKLVELGDKIIGALASDPGQSKRQSRNFKTQLPEFKDDGKPRMEEVLHFIAMPGITARLGTAETSYEPIQPGTHIRWAASGHKWGQVIDARKALPATSGLRSGQPGGGDVYEIELVGWSASTENPGAAQQAGFTVRDGRIILNTQEERERYILARTRANQNTNTAAELLVTTRRPTPAEKAWEDQADALWLTKPWEASDTAPKPADSYEPFDNDAGF